MTFPEIKQRLSKKTVGIAGAGGLGSNCAVALARAGVGKIIIADFDVVSEGNLNRQFFFFDQIGLPKASTTRENIGRINPDVLVEAHDVMLTPENIPQLFSSCDVIVEAFDLADQKQMLIETVQTVMPEKPLVIGLGIAGYGNNELIHYRRIGNMHICGDVVTEIGEQMPPIAPRVGIVANMQANTVMEILLSENEDHSK